jgi:hypothetical protein
MKIAKPIKTPRSLLRYSVHVLNALKTNFPSLEDKGLFQYSNGTSSTVVGGTQSPKHLGQSGQPIPAPVLLTIPPTKTRNKTKKKEVLMDLL